MPKVVIAGCGFLGETAAGFFSAAGWEVSALCRTPSAAARLADRPYLVEAVDITTLTELPSCAEPPDALIHCVSSRGGGPDEYQKLYVDGLLNLVAALKPRRTLFVGSTSVYAQCDGSWVDEESPTDPSRPTGRLLLEAEGVVRACGGYVVRLAGLYGPGRSVLVENFLAGTSRLEGDAGRWINLIHRDDAARALLHLFVERAAPGIYNVSDGHPTRQGDLQREMAEFFHRPVPPAGEPDRNRRRGWTSKRVSNQKLRSTGWEPRWRRFREALPGLA